MLKARKQKDFKRSDELREQINKKGFNVDDILEGPKIEMSSKKLHH